ncbi:MAG: CHAT domain-containing protein [Thermoanaerobaculia bacterium]|nr:CHAT domain-containing protein [Thermoanaerobaculia bacterium]
MKPTDYLDLELQVIHRDRARLLCPDQQQYAGRALLDGDLDDRLRELELAKDYQGYGRALFDACFPAGSELHRGIYSMLDRSRSEKRRIRLRLNVDTTLAEAVHNFHWELISDGDELEPARSPEILFSRYVAQPFVVGPAPTTPRLLCVIAAPTDAHHYQMAPIDYDLTSRYLKEYLAKLQGRLEIDFLERPATPERLREKLQSGKYHLLHVHGHGMMPRDGEAALVLENADHKVNFTTESALRGILLGLSDLKLVTLIACHGGVVSNKEDQLSGLAGALVRRNVPAVIAMRRAISMNVGLRFSSLLYQQLAKDPRVDAAVNEARHRLFMDKPQGVDWSSPVLYMRLPDGLLWSTASVSSTEEPTTTEITTTVSPWGGRWRRAALLTQIAAVILAFSFPNVYYDWIEGKLTVESYRPPTSSITRPAPPPPSKAQPQPATPQIEYRSIVPGTIGVGAIDRNTLAWRSDVARLLSDQIRAKRKDLKPVIIPEAYRRKLGNLLDGDLSSLPGGGKSPYGYEYIFFAAETHGDNPAKIVNFPTVNVSCGMVLVSTREPDVRSSQTFDHTGQAGTETGALQQAFGRCFDSSLGELP